MTSSAATLPPLPALPVEPTRASFPVVAVVAPIVGAVAIGLITGSPYVLIFALLSPLIAVGSMLDARRTSRRARRADEARFESECSHFLTVLTALQAEEAAGALRGAMAGMDDGTAPVLVGIAPGPSRHRTTEVPATGASVSTEEGRRAALAARAALNPAMPVTVPRGQVRVSGHGPSAEGLRIALRTLPGVRLLAPDDELDEDGVVEIVIESLRHARLRGPDGERQVRLIVPSRRQCELRRRENDSLPLPTRVEWADLDSAETPGLPIGRRSAGPAVLDIVADGPHLLVGGTTGSGKSEFLRVLVLSIAARYSPEQWSMLLVDFKGGATFADLDALPHCAGVITDLDEALADRALRSLQAEIRRRERLLAERGARDLRDCETAMPRLLVLVDEYAAMVQSFPDLQQIFADLSARGRSLGIHLVLCTQRPHGVVRDAVVANCAIRVVFRTTESADARAVLGSDAPDARDLPPGRALLAVGGTISAVQVALLGADDVASVAQRHAPLSATARATSRPWAPPLPPRIHLDSATALPHDATDEEPIIFGALDDVDRQRWGAAVWSPRVDGALAILGAPGSGRTTSLATISTAARHRGWGVIRVPESPADAMDVLQRIAADPPTRTLMVMDDLGAFVTSLPSEHSAMMVETWDAASAAMRQHGGAAAAVLGTATGAQRLLAGRFGARLCLRALDEDDHALSGAPRRSHDRRAPSGRAWWGGDRVQVAVTPRPLLAAARPAVLRVPLTDAPLAIITGDASRTIDRVRRVDPERTFCTELTALDATVFSAGIALDRVALIGDPDDWQRAWALWSHARRQLDLVMDAVSDAEVRALVGARVAQPLVDQRRGDVVYRPASAPISALERRRWPGSPD